MQNSQKQTCFLDRATGGCYYDSVNNGVHGVPFEKGCSVDAVFFFADSGNGAAERRDKAPLRRGGNSLREDFEKSGHHIIKARQPGAQGVKHAGEN